MDPELARYLNRNYWEQKHEEVKSAAPSGAPSGAQPSAPMAAANSTNPQDKDADTNKENEVLTGLMLSSMISISVTL